jgi:hypothetical protein
MMVLILQKKDDSNHWTMMNITTANDIIHCSQAFNLLTSNKKNEASNLYSNCTHSQQLRSTDQNISKAIG